MAEAMSRPLPPPLCIERDLMTVCSEILLTGSQMKITGACYGAAAPLSALIHCCAPKDLE